MSLLSCAPIPTPVRLLDGLQRAAVLCLDETVLVFAIAQPSCFEHFNFFSPHVGFGFVQAVLDALTELNGVYREKFGFVFLVCASGKPADEILALLKARLPNDRDTEVLL